MAADYEGIRERLKAKAAKVAEPEADEDVAPAASETGAADNLDSCFSPEQAQAIRDAIKNAK